MCRVITISRQFGSGGRSIGKAVAEKLGWKFYDREIVEKTAAESGFSPKFIEESGEYAGATNSLLFNLSVAGAAMGNGRMSLYDEIYVTQKKIIEQLAEDGNCVIVGRCADYILRNRSDVLNVFIYSDTKSRAERITRLYGTTDKSAESRLAEKDKKRRVYYKNYTDRSWGDFNNYHISLNSGFIGIDKCADIIEELARM